MRIKGIESRSDPRLEKLVAWLAAQRPGEFVELVPASADASFRRYFRLTRGDGSTAMAMDAPPPAEDVRPFLRVNALLRSAGVHAPEVYASHVEAGFLLLEDLGHQTYLEAFARLAPSEIDAAMRAAIETLLRLQQIALEALPADFPRYDAALLERELALFPEWYVGRHRGLEWSAAERERFTAVARQLVAFALAQPRVFVHRDFMPRNLIYRPGSVPGVLDHQDAVIGPVSYDIASLVRDAFHSWAEEQVIDWVARYWDGARRARLPVPEDFAQFYREVEWMGLQRHLKVLGIFARIYYRDGKPKYLADTPRFIGYVRAVALRYRDFAPLLALVDRLEGIAHEHGATF
ncbi:MAG: phosphotransferase [Casimicrobiaceae bacterium]|nr:phosphotransferase [Casimicrobiaceae bacterium]MCX8097477.1 phosphotransferase [Casimicrobiaceae bacterium]MDW8311195.1 phosphotransferase [Burkholderiales bacterium]